MNQHPQKLNHKLFFVNIHTRYLSSVLRLEQSMLSDFLQHAPFFRSSFGHLVDQFIIIRRHFYHLQKSSLDTVIELTACVHVFRCFYQVLEFNALVEVYLPTFQLVG